MRDFGDMTDDEGEAYIANEIARHREFVESLLIKRSGHRSSKLSVMRASEDQRLVADGRSRLSGVSGPANDQSMGNYALLVTDGRVSCPLRGDVDADTCYSCRYLRGVTKGEGGGDAIVCRPQRAWVDVRPR